MFFWNCCCKQEFQKNVSRSYVPSSNFLDTIFYVALRKITRTDDLFFGSVTSSASSLGEVYREVMFLVAIVLDTIFYVALRKITRTDDLFFDSVTSSASSMGEVYREVMFLVAIVLDTIFYVTLRKSLELTICFLVPSLRVLRV